MALRMKIHLPDIFSPYIFSDVVVKNIIRLIIFKLIISPFANGWTEPSRAYRCSWHVDEWSLVDNEHFETTTATTTENDTFLSFDRERYPQETQQ